MEYPCQVLFSEQAQKSGAVRLRVAVIAALLDSGTFEGTDFSEAERKAFLVDTETWRPPQTFFAITPIGNLASATQKVTQAIERSISENQLRPAFARFNVSGEVDPINTWLFLGEVSDWMATRGLDTGDLFEQLWDDEVNVFIAAQKAGDEFRTRLETPDVQLELEVLRAEADWDEPTEEKFTELLKMNAALKAGTRQAAASDHPISTRERETLLSIIGVLCKEAKIAYEKPSKAANLIHSTAEHMGVRIGESTIENHLKKVPDALATRMK